jgi:hypothetical protein
MRLPVSAYLKQVYWTKTFGNISQIQIFNLSYNMHVRASGKKCKKSFFTFLLFQKLTLNNQIYHVKVARDGKWIRRLFFFLITFQLFSAFQLYLCTYSDVSQLVET